MGHIAKNATPKVLLISNNNITIEIDRSFLSIIGYSEEELIGRSLVEISKILRIDSQSNLQDMQEDITVIMFTKLLVPIKVTISSKAGENQNQKIFLYKIYHNTIITKGFEFALQLSTNQKTGVAIFTFPNLVLINCNQNYLDFLNSPYNIRFNSLGKRLDEMLSDYDYANIEKINTTIMNTGMPFYIEEGHFSSSEIGDGYWNMSVVPIFIKGKIGYIILSILDVTEKVLNRQLIEQKNEELEAVIENISDELVIFDKDGYYTKVNKSARLNNFCDYTVLKNIKDIPGQADIRDRMGQQVPFSNLPSQRIMRGESFSGYEIITKNKKGVKHKEVSGTPIYDKEGNFSVGVMVYHDIGNRIRREEALLIEAQYELLNIVIEKLELEFTRCSYPDLKIVDMNQKCYDNLKQINPNIGPPLSLKGQSFSSVYSIDEQAKKSELVYNLIEKKSDSYIDYRNHVINGEERFLKTINQPLFGLNNQIVEMIFITIDITDDVKAKNKMDEMQGQIFTNISHELKTPLNVIFSATQLMEMHLKDDFNKVNKSSIIKNIEIIKQNCYRFIRLSNNIIDLSKIESGFFKINLSNENIVEIIEDIVDSVIEYVKDKGLNIVFDTDIEEKIMAIDVDKMERIILNLISNAIKFSNKGDKINVNIKDKGNFVEISVGDSGIGIDEKHLDYIFNRYHKIDSTLTRNAEGSGIGLTLVKTMVEKLGGRINVESKVGKGSLFKLELPVSIVQRRETTSRANFTNSKIDRINIEFSDIYAK